MQTPERPCSGLLLAGNVERGRSIAAAAVAPVASPATAATVAATRAGFTRLGLINREAATVVVLVVEALDGRLGLGLAAHLHEAEALAAARVTVLDDLRALDVPECGEQLLQVGTADLIGQVPDIQFLTHYQSP